MDSTEANAALRYVKALWWLLLVTGVLSIVVGIIVLVQPGISLATLAVITGIFFLADGIIEIARAAIGDTANRALLGILGVVSAIAGVILIRHPTSAVVAIALLLGLWLITVGIVRFMRALDDRERRTLTMVVAAIEVIAGIVIVSSPDIGVKTLAVVVAISFILRGLVLCGIAWATRAVTRALSASSPTS
jgi:uncharacterized membrane protein HdeD (DUF308 family)